MRRSTGGIRSLRGYAVREKDGAFAAREQFGSQIWCGDADRVGVVAKRPIVELRKFPDATLDAGTDGGRAKDAVLPELQSAIPSLCQEFCDRLIRDSGKEKDVVEVALARKFGLPLG